MGVPYVPIRGLMGSDMMKRRDDMLVVPNPFDSTEKSVVAKAITPDIAVFHGLKADKAGNVLTVKGREELIMGQASRRVIWTVEEIVDEIDPDDITGRYIPTIEVDIVVHAPQGAYPSKCLGYYDTDDDHMREYVKAAASDETFQEYLEKYVFAKAVAAMA